MENTYDVIIIGGGATGAGVARDCSLRGIKALLLERSDISTGATGRNHGLLHSGARYAVTDHESAVECIRENMILRKVASHCVEETGLCPPAAEIRRGVARQWRLKIYILSWKLRLMTSNWCSRLSLVKFTA